jgi:hypothetical protein
MKYVRILVEPIMIKADVEDEDQLKHDVYEKLSAMIESETLSFSVADEEEDEELDF